MLRAAAVVCVLTATAAAAPKPVKLLGTKEVTVGDRGWIVHTVRFVAATPILSATLNHMMAEGTRTAGWLEDGARSPAAGDIYCQVDFATSVYVSWTCRGLASNSNGSYHFYSGANFVIDDDGKFVPPTMAMIFAPGVTLDKLSALKGTDKNSDECTIRTDAGWEITGSGFRVNLNNGEVDYDFCELSWESLAGKLVKDNFVQRAIAVGSIPTENAPPTESVAGWAKQPPRFVPEADDTVRDLSTGLLWTAHDNGADTTWDEALMLARKKGGDWKLPTEAQLEGIVDPEYAHREKTDCTKGKNDLLLTPAIHLSCGLVWTDGMLDGDRAVGVGFISGTPRISKQAEKKNYRVLLVKADKKKR